LNALDDAHQAAGIRHVSVVQKKAPVPVMRILVEMIDTIRVKQGRAALHSMDFIPLGEKQLSKI